MVISIDIGTSYSSVCLLNQEGKAEPVEISTGISIYGGKYSLPSAVFVDDSGKVLVGQAAMNSRKRMPQNFRSEFKRDLGQNIPIVLGNRSFLPEDLYAELFRHMKECAEKRGMEEVEKAYITYPASSGKAKQEKIEQAARKAGLFDTELIDEPTAVAMCYGEKGTLKDGDVLLVYDFGGGTFDAAVLKYEDGEYEPLAPAAGIEHCGGIDIDRAVYSDMYSRIAPELLQPLLTNRLNKFRLERQLAELAVKVKHHLSTAEYACEDITVGFDTVEYRLDCDGLEKMAVGLVAQTIDCCRSILNSAGITVSELDGILLAGGTSRMPLVQKMVREFAGDMLVHTDIDPDLAVVQGALFGKRKNVDLEETEDSLRDDKNGSEEKVCDSINLPINSESKGNTREDIIKWYRENISSLISCMPGDEYKGYGELFAVKADGNIIAKNHIGMDGWNDIISIAVSYKSCYILGLRKDGTVVYIRKGLLRYSTIADSICSWTGITSIVIFDDTPVGLSKDGTVVVPEGFLKKRKHKFGVDELARKTKNRTFISIGVWSGVGEKHIFFWGVCKDGTVIIVVNHEYDVRDREVERENWTDIVSICGAKDFTAGLRKDGTVIVAKDKWNARGRDYSSVEKWTDIVSICSGDVFIAGLRNDGTVVTCNLWDADVTGKWTDIVSISGGRDILIGLRKDGHVVTAGGQDLAAMNDWEKIVAVDYFRGIIGIGLTVDGRVICTNYTLSDFDKFIYLDIGISHRERKEVDKVFTRDTRLKLF